MRAFHLLLCSFLLTTPLLVACGGSSEPTTPGSTSAAGAGGAAADVALETDQQKVLYTLGSTLGEGLPQLGLSEEDMVYVAAGLRDTLDRNASR